MKKLITFLGRGAFHRDGVRQEYRQSRYDFGDIPEADGWICEPAKHFAHAVYKFYQRAGQKRFGSVTVFGTSGSMWDALVDSFGKDDAAVTDLWESVVHHVDAQTVDKALLKEFSARLSAATDCNIQLELLPPAATGHGQAEILNQLLAQIEKGDRVWLDVTHGFRHLPMLGLAAAAVSASVKGASIDEIGYGAGDMTRDGLTPVISLKWILKLFSVLGAANELANHRQLRPLIECFPSGKIRNQLENAAYKLDVMRIDDASVAIKNCVTTIKQESADLPVELQVVTDALVDRLKRFAGQQRNAAGLTHMASLALEVDDFLRVAVYLFEAVNRAEEEGHAGDGDQDRKLRQVRNWLAHAGRLALSRDDKEVRKMVENRKALRQFFRDQIDRIRGELVLSQEN